MIFLQLSTPLRSSLSRFLSFASHGNGAPRFVCGLHLAPGNPGLRFMATKTTAATTSYSVTMRGLLPSRAIKVQTKVTANGSVQVVTALLTNRGNALVDGEAIPVDMPPVFCRFREAAGRAALATKASSWVLVEVSGWLAPLGAPEQNERGYWEAPAAMIIVDRIAVIKTGHPVEPDA